MSGSGDTGARRFRLLALAGIALVLMAGYATARPATESLFLEVWGRDALPLAWGGVAVGAGVVTAGWERLAARTELALLLALVALGSAAALGLLLGLHHAGWRGASFLLYLWKDLYIVALVETFYAFTNVVFRFETARKAYGLFGAMGSLGGIAGNLGVGRLAARWGTSGALLALFPLLALVAGAALLLSRRAGAFRERAAAPRPPGLGEGLRVVRRSAYLGWLLVLVATVQVAVTVVDFAYNGALQAAWPDTDARTAVIGRVYASIDAIAFVLHLLTPSLLAALGVGRTLLGVPGLLLGALLGAIALPAFLPVAIAKVASKCFDYTLFRAAKEALYLPLPYRQKTEGKGVVDLLTYRVAKGGASVLTLGMVAAGWQRHALALAAALAGLWVLCTLAVLRRYRRLPARRGEPPEPHPGGS